MTEPMKQGTLARVTEGCQDLVKNSLLGGVLGHRQYPAGFEFEVEDFVSAEQSEDGRAFYWGSAGGGGNNICVLAADVEQVKSTEEMDARALPEAKQLLDFICSAMLGDGEGMTIEGMHMEDREIAGFGTTDDGLDFEFSIPLTEIYIRRSDV